MLILYYKGNYNYYFRLDLTYLMQLKIIITTIWWWRWRWYYSTRAGSSLCSRETLIHLSLLLQLSPLRSISSLIKWKQLQFNPFMLHVLPNAVYDFKISIISGDKRNPCYDKPSSPLNIYSSLFKPNVFLKISPELWVKFYFQIFFLILTF